MMLQEHRPSASTGQQQEQQEDEADEQEQEQHQIEEDDDEDGRDDTAQQCRHCSGSGRATNALEGLSSKPASSIYDPESMRYLSLDYASDVIRRWTWNKSKQSQHYPHLPEPCCSSSETCDHRRTGGASLGRAAVIHHDTASFERCLGYPPEVVEGTWQWWEDRIHTDDRQRVCLSLERFFENPTARFWSESYRFRIYRPPSSTPSTPTPRLSRASQFYYGKWQPSSPHEQMPLPATSGSSPALSEVSEHTVMSGSGGNATGPSASSSSSSATPRMRPKPPRRFQSSSTSTRTDESSNSSQHTHHFREDTAPEDFLTILDQLHITRDKETGHPKSAIGAMFSPEQRMKIAEALNAPRVRLLRSVPKGGIQFIGSETIHTILDNTASGLFMMDAKGHPTFMNTAASQITGYASIDEIKHAPLHYAVHYKRPDGSHYPMEECPIDNSNAQVVRVQNQTETFVRKDGTLFPVVWSCVPIERMGNTIGCVIEFRDVTDERNMEQDRIKATLTAKHQDIRIKEAILHKQKMTQFVDYIAHELRNPLHGIAANVDFLRDSLGLLQQSISRTLTEIDRVEPQDPIQEVSSPRQARQLSLTSANRPRSPAMRSSEALSAAVAGVPIGVSHAVLRDQSHLGNTSKSYTQKSHSASSSSMPEKEPSPWHTQQHQQQQQQQQHHSSDDKLSNITRSSPAAIAVSPLLADIASSTATSNALMKSHDQVMHEQHYSPGLPTPARTTSPSAVSIQTQTSNNSNSNNVLESQNILSSAQSFITSIRECVSHATHITNNVLDLSRFEAGKVELLDDVIHPVRVAGLAIDMMSARAQEKDITLALNSPKEDIVVRGDGTRLAQVFLNLLSNAIKFTPANGTVTLSFTMALENGRWLLSGYVTDTGVGMSAQEMKNLFQRFGQSSRSIQAEYGGTGLGLSICQEIVQLQGGKMDVTSEKGKGSTFSFTAYYNKATDKDAQENIADATGASRRESTSELSSGSGESLSGLTATALYKVLPAVATIAGEPGKSDATLASLSDSQREQFEAVRRQVEESAQQRTPFTFKHILVAEDNSINQNIMKTYLRKLGYGFTIVANGQEVVDFYLKTVNNDTRIDLVLMDCEMPILDGRQATASIRQFEAHVKDFVTPLASPVSIHSSASTINALTTPGPLGTPSNDYYFSPGATSPVLAPRRRVPIVGLSGNARKELVDQAFASGMDDYIVKPFKLQELERVIKKWEKKIDDEMARQAVTVAMKKAIRERLDSSLSTVSEAAETAMPDHPERPPLSRQAAGHLGDEQMAQGESSSYEESAQSSTSTIPSLSSYASRGSSAPSSQSPSLQSDGDIRSSLYAPKSEQ